MIRFPGLLLVLTLALAPGWHAGVCLPWCAPAAHTDVDRAACHGAAGKGPVLAAHDEDCGVLLAGTLFLREETRQGPATLAPDAGRRSGEPQPAAPPRRLAGLPTWSHDLAPPAFTAVLRI